MRLRGHGKFDSVRICLKVLEILRCDREVESSRVLEDCLKNKIFPETELFAALGGLTYVKQRQSEILLRPCGSVQIRVYGKARGIAEPYGAGGTEGLGFNLCVAPT